MGSRPHALLAAGMLLLGAASAASADETLLFDFEQTDWSGWHVEGSAFGTQPVLGERLEVSGFEGRRLANSFHDSDAATGHISSPPFQITADYLSFLIAGGNLPDRAGVQLLVDEVPRRSASGADSPVMQWRSWDVRDLRGRQARLRIIDQATGAWGHVNVDQVMLVDRPRGSLEILLADFESSDFGAWRVAGDAFGDGPAGGTLDHQMAVSGFLGEKLLNSYHSGDGATGQVESPPFVLSLPYISFLIGGGQLPGKAGVELLVEGRPQRSATGNASETLSWHSWDVSSLLGKEAQLRVFDRATGGWGHILLDQVVLGNTARARPAVGRLASYRGSTSYYQERFRPGYHFTPEINWMNDPNGLVYLDGEYHLFYQHNPHGIAWGHMSWGHAVSRDLLHWQHLPIALHEEYGVSIFSGSAVVDRNNTSGFGDGDRPPLVAIYTGHGHGLQTQDLAYSTNHGRNWTKYAGNPVLDIQQQDFRDPKVFWHEPTARWVMVVALAAEKRLQLYGSPDLKGWTLLSEFGPAGVLDKPNWECPDLFRLPVEGEPGVSRWVLEADMGAGSIAGGSGGEYFIGQFDGNRFTPDSLDSRWVDYGPDFYAPISWSDIPAEDGRRIWIGWMNNWQTAQNPTHPWCGAMSIPRELTLRRLDGELLLCQRPVRELEDLRHEPFQLHATQIRDRTLALEPAGRQWDIQLVLHPQTAKTCGIRVLKEGDQFTEIGYEAGELYVDRTRSGDTSFHPAFAGRHAGPLKPATDGSVRLRILVDRSSVEVFGGEGQTVITSLVFPPPGGDQLELFASGGTARIQCTAHRIKSSMP